MALTMLEAMRLTEQALFRPLLARMLEDGVKVERIDKAWRCNSGAHRYHRNKAAAARCAFRALPMRKIG